MFAIYNQFTLSNHIALAGLTICLAVWLVLVSVLRNLTMQYHKSINVYNPQQQNFIILNIVLGYKLQFYRDSLKLAQENQKPVLYSYSFKILVSNLVSNELRLHSSQPSMLLFIEGTLRSMGRGTSCRRVRRVRSENCRQLTHVVVFFFCFGLFPLLSSLFAANTDRELIDTLDARVRVQMRTANCEICHLCLLNCCTKIRVIPRTAF